MRHSGCRVSRRVPGATVTNSPQGGNVQGIRKAGAQLLAIGVVIVAFSACSKKENYGADTSAAAVDTSTSTSMSASSTAPAMQDTTASTTAPMAKKSSTKKTSTKTTTKKS